MHETDAEVYAISFDGPSINVSTSKILGTQISEDVIKPYFFFNKKLDACYKLKVVNNAMASREVIFD